MKPPVPDASDTSDTSSSAGRRSGVGGTRRLVVGLVVLAVLIAAVAVPVALLLTGDDEPQGGAAGRAPAGGPSSGGEPGSEPDAESGPTTELDVVQEVAEEFFVRFNTYGPDLLAEDGTMPDYRAGVEELATPELRATFGRAVELAEQSVAEGGVERTSQVTATGVSALGPARAVVLVSGATLTSGGDPVGLRASVVLRRQEGEQGGAWLVDDFAPVLAGAEVDADLARGGVTGVGDRAQAAASAARDAAPLLLGSDYRTPEEDLTAALEVTTESFGADFAQTYRSLRDQAREVESVVEPVVVGVGVSSVAPRTVEVLVLVDRDATTTQGSQTFGDQVTFTMTLVDGTWLVDGLSTTG